MDDSPADAPQADVPQADAPRADAPQADDSPADTPRADAPYPDAPAPVDPTEPLANAPRDRPPADVTAQLDDPHDPSTQPLPQPVEAPRATGDNAPAAEPPSPTDPAATAPASSPATWLAQHRTPALIAVACAIALAAILALRLTGNRYPTDAQVKTDAQTHLAAPAHAASDYDSGNPLVLQDVQVTARQRSATRSDACTVAVQATFASEALETVADGTLTYVRTGDGWRCTAATTGNASHTALQGVSSTQAIAHVADLLTAADTSEHGTDGLATLYRDAEVSVVSDAFDPDAQTDDLTLRCSTTGTFVSHQCELTGHFRFAQASGAWELAGAQVSDDAWDLSFEPLLGTWHGTFASQEASQAKCLGARDAGLDVTITKVEPTGGGVRIEGSLSGVAHLHADLEADADQTEGDRPLADVPFAGALSAGEEQTDIIALLSGAPAVRDHAGIVFDCVTQDQAGGTVTLRLTFGTASAPDAATATLTSTHDYEDSFLLLISYRREARFADTFTLEKTAA